VLAGSQHAFCETQALQVLPLISQAKLTRPPEPAFPVALLLTERSGVSLFISPSLPLSATCSRASAHGSLVSSHRFPPLPQQLCGKLFKSAAHKEPANPTYRRTKRRRSFFSHSQAVEKPGLLKPFSRDFLELRASFSRHVADHTPRLTQKHKRHIEKMICHQKWL